MGLSNDLATQFAKITNDNKKNQNGSTVYGTAVSYAGKIYVRIDGSDLLTPCSSAVSVKPGERVMMTIKDHSATVTGNITTPAASSATTNSLSDQVFHKVTAEELDVFNASVDNLKAIFAKFENAEIVNADIENLKARMADIEHLTADDIKAITAEIESLEVKVGTFEDLEAEDLKAVTGEITNLKGYVADYTYVSADILDAIQATIKELDVEKLSADEADIKYATIEKTEIIEAEIERLDAEKLTAKDADLKYATIGKVEIIEADIERLDAEKLTAKDADLKYANIDFTNITEAAIEKVFADSGIIGDLVMDNGNVTGTLVGVTIKGDLIEGGTVKADKLVVKGDDGLFYKLNFEGGNFVGGEEVPDDGLHGSVIVANSITAEKINVKDLVAFDATIGGFHITDNSIYSGVKESVDNTTRGIYLDNDGQVAYGDSNNFLKYFKDQNGEYKLEISANSLIFSATNKTVEETIEDIRNDVDNLVDIEIGARNLIRNSVNMIFSDYYFYDPNLTVEYDNAGNVTVYYVPLYTTHDEVGNVNMYGVRAEHDETGNITLSE